MFENYRKVVHIRTDSLELWGYYIEYAVDTQRISEILESLQYFRNKCAIKSQTIALYNNLAAKQIRYTIYKNQ